MLMNYNSDFFTISEKKITHLILKNLGNHYKHAEFGYFLFQNQMACFLHLMCLGRWCLACKKKSGGIIMCFRPTAAAKVIICPGCQKKLTQQQGHIAKTCPFCGTDITQVEGTTTEQPK